MLRSNAGVLATLAAVAAAPLFSALFTAGAANAAERRQLAFLHDPAPGHGSHGGGCFVTTHPTHGAKGIRHWRRHCPHHDPKKLNNYHPHHHGRP